MQDFFGKTEEAYTYQRAALLDLEESLKGKEEKKSLITDNPPPPRTTLPRIQLQFSGKIEEARLAFILRPVQLSDRPRSFSFGCTI